ncbi:MULTISPECIES: phosphoribosylamine--glycine ligase [unclassified Paenibacillus]|uniref:phosphoribosylamine--glycine ligase n=1 Tax=unclassified Paenibacillus TaxID=185978 RepID=UPI00020D7105|nr:MULTISPECIES: phosphoribosylamine--glycine ligase [unclassified Paenibacillus]EGL16324.1 phosphoribosylamine--glycine ligase [Paenibacillus sp. HGF7]EPD88926.1 phosphoribosylamine-glycine ligase [Paenibacillus sp. HGH0039]
MRILVIGRGGREHAIVWSLRKSPKVTALFCAPGNGGIAELAECVPITEFQFAEIAEFVRQNAIDLVVVGPDDPLYEGIVDYLEEHGIRAYGPNRAAAEIEGSKVFMKHLLKKYEIPTAAYEAFEDYEAALAYLRKLGAPIVIKADGLAAGKGVIVASTLEEAEKALKEIMVEKQFGASGNRVVIEEFLQGQEMSLLAFVDGNVVKPMVPSQDHKPVFDGDKGPNTGGMGTYSPVPHIPQEIVQQALDTIVKPAAEAMVKEGRPFRGVLYAGLMITADGPKTIEFNARFGDPETQVILPRLKNDLLEIILATLEGRLADLEIEWSEEAAVCVILASGGYPGSYPKGLPIEGLDAAGGALVFHAGTALEDGRLVTSGGRVLGVTALGRDIADAREKAYAAADRISFEGKQNRTDIALKALNAMK